MSEAQFISSLHLSSLLILYFCVLDFLSQIINGRHILLLLRLKSNLGFCERGSCFCGAGDSPLHLLSQAYEEGP